MRLQILFTDRVGIAQEILAVLAARLLDVVAVEVDPPHIYLEAPGLSAALYPEVREALMQVHGVRRVTELAMLPGARRRLYLDALLAALADPVLVVDDHGTVVVANPAAAQACGLSEDALAGRTLAELTGDAQLAAAVTAPGDRLPVREVQFGGQPYLLEATALHEAGGHVAGAVVTLHAPHRLGERLSALQNYSAGGFEAILGHSAAIRQLRQRAARVAQVDAPLLIRGETGTGKELVAHACHAGSRRRDQPFFALNCAALPESLAESELFGYAPGAFTGALRGGRPGLLELADGGTLFLDEVAEMSPYLQAKLLRFLNDGSFRRVGGERELRADVRIISATHRSLEDMVAAGSFRQDLLFRLDVLQLYVPPLRERREDILPLAQVFIERACAQAGRPRARLSRAAAQALLANPWHGNVRQLQNVIFRAVTMSDRSVIDVDDLELAGAATAPAPELGDEQVTSLHEAVERYERALLQRLWPQYPSTRRLAERLGTSHTAIAARLRKYGIPGGGTP
ncbi:sigma 54-interacting transcriptional regulator [Caldimonas thermodepolymerans]|uniref:HTH-type transcriptional regulatory protein TyrR n=1 Tax=Caldimonas thermodepolymerans TaxID=215580 RepID=A0A2S5T0T6_9BURK|nr:sigma 54-interacting transcriptional regulator [Caldimonas thermodepolymerans]PPE68498.1 Fis family transcriptional regulator [Caldimonas thermodepolymerans]QPC31473.1 sigma 54-interacting transcriptional regulator [Caldimonas thermodepolymerans]RDH99552.1 PAS domain S-box-containing protein/TyrR family helix-turn-helix protein [Caldimonas thermodepolymerans]